ncbi:hypothetical protein EII18_01135 [Comamonadaceae bacterium OH3737_COT-264]|nr:hypothetical protein EII18_01135 [Comamonadaceae bacterium OH3737_COT-264]
MQIGVLKETVMQTALAHAAQARKAQRRGGQQACAQAYGQAATAAIRENGRLIDYCKSKE